MVWNKCSGLFDRWAGVRFSPFYMHCPIPYRFPCHKLSRVPRRFSPCWTKVGGAGCSVARALLQSVVSCVCWCVGVTFGTRLGVPKGMYVPGPPRRPVKQWAALCAKAPTPPELSQTQACILPSTVGWWAVGDHFSARRSDRPSQPYELHSKARERMLVSHRIFLSFGTRLPAGAAAVEPGPPALGQELCLVGRGGQVGAREHGRPRRLPAAVRAQL